MQFSVRYLNKRKLHRVQVYKSCAEEALGIFINHQVHIFRPSFLV